jgi:hypothetical protein
MIRIRNKDGSHVDIDQNNYPFVELINDMDNTVGRLFIQVEPGKLIEVYPNTTDAERYEALMSKHGVKFADMIIHKKT